MVATPPSALLVVLNDVEHDPRVRRQIEWLAEAGWQVDTLGLGSHPADAVREHFAIKKAPSWTSTSAGLAFIHAFLPVKKRFEILLQNQFPQQVGTQIAAGMYDLVLFNDIQLLPWLRDLKVFLPSDTRTHIHLDLHEWFDAKAPRNSRGRALLQPYYSYGRSQIGNSRIDSRSLAADARDMYAEEFHIDAPPIVLNAPRFVEQSPSAVGNTIRLLHHGVAAWERGLRELVDVMPLLDERFSLTFMLAGNKKTIADLAELSKNLGDRIKIVPPVPMTELARRINEFDVEVMFYPPKSVNLEIALPNKFFEAIQGRLALVVGPTKTMSEIIRRERNGLVTSGWAVQDLADTINSLTKDSVTQMKSQSSAIAQDFCAESERERFFSSIGFPMAAAH